jgi:hypothetical protein
MTRVVFVDLNGDRSKILYDDGSWLSVSYEQARRCAWMLTRMSAS